MAALRSPGWVPGRKKSRIVGGVGGAGGGEAPRPPAMMASQAASGRRRARREGVRNRRSGIADPGDGGSVDPEWTDGRPPADLLKAYPIRQGWPVGLGRGRVKGGRVARTEGT